MELKNVLNGAHLDYAFPAKWHQIKEAFYASLRSDQSIKRWSKHFANGPSTFTNRPMEQAIHDIDVHVNKAHGTSEATHKDAKGKVHSLVTHRLMAKYRLIFEVAEQLPTEVKQTLYLSISIINNVRFNTFDRHPGFQEESENRIYSKRESS